MGIFDDKWLRTVWILYRYMSTFKHFKIKTVRILWDFLFKMIVGLKSKEWMEKDTLNKQKQIIYIIIKYNCTKIILAYNTQPIDNYRNKMYGFTIRCLLSSKRSMVDCRKKRKYLRFMITRLAWKNFYWIILLSTVSKIYFAVLN